MPLSLAVRIFGLLEYANFLPAFQGETADIPRFISQKNNGFRDVEHSSKFWGYTAVELGSMVSMVFSASLSVILACQWFLKKSCPSYNVRTVPHSLAGIETKPGGNLLPHEINSRILQSERSRSKIARHGMDIYNELCRS